MRLEEFRTRGNPEVYGWDIDEPLSGIHRRLSWRPEDFDSFIEYASGPFVLKGERLLDERNKMRPPQRGNRFRIQWADVLVGIIALVLAYSFSSFLVRESYTEWRVWSSIIVLATALLLGLYRLSRPRKSHRS